MVFLSICTALYDYAPQNEGELEIKEGELVYILEKGTEDDWWKGKKRAANDEDEEPTGLIPNNYVEEARPTHHAKALYDYSRQTDEELSFSEDAALSVYDTSDPDWTLVGLDGEYGFAPANYIEITSQADQPHNTSALSPPLPQRPVEQEATTNDLPDSPIQSPAANLASIIHKQATGAAPGSRKTVQFTPEASDDEAPPPRLPQRPPSEHIPSPQIREPSPPRHQSPPMQLPSPRLPSPQRSPDIPGVIASPPLNRASRSQSDATNFPSSPGGYHLYNINEMVSIMGKQKKMPTTLGINLATGVIMIIPEKKRDGPQQEWTAEKMTHYSIEGKHIFLELVKPSKSIDFHCGAKDTANEIVSSLGELAGMSRGGGLEEVLAAGSASGKSQKRGHMLYDFMAQGDDEVTVADGDEVIVLDDAQSEEWWKVRRIKNGKEGVVPSSYVEVTGVASVPIASPSTSGLNAGRSVVEQNRIEEQRLAKEALKAAQNELDKDITGSEVGPGLKLPNRASSLMAGHESGASASQRGKRDSRTDNKTNSTKSKPDMAKVRTWTDRSGSFKVEAQFIGLKDGKIHLHKLNGVKIAVPVVKMAAEDLEYVENVTGESLDEDKPLSDIRRKSLREQKEHKKPNGHERKRSLSGPASVQQSQKSEYDWFGFFLECGVSPHQCERYSYNFNRDSMDESVLSEITPAVLRNLGLKEGDILRVMKHLDAKLNRASGKSKLNVSFGGEEVIGNDENGVTSPAGSLFSGPGGALRNNTRKGRPAPAVQTNDVVDSKVFQQNNAKSEPKLDKATPESPQAPEPPKKDVKGSFDDDAWDVKPSRQPTRPSQADAPAPSSAIGSAPTPAPTATTAAPPQPPLSGAMADLSLLSEPLKPIVTHTTGIQQPAQSQLQPLPQPTMPQSIQGQQPTQQSFQQPLQSGASPSFFNQLGQQPTGMASQQGNQPQVTPQFTPQQTGQFQSNIAPRQRPQAPPAVQQQGALMPPPPSRPLSAPQNATPRSNFGPPPLQPQLTGITNPMAFQNQMTSPTQTLNDLNRMRLQQQMGQQQALQPQFTSVTSPPQQYGQFPTGFPQQQTNFSQQQPLQPQTTAFQPSPFTLGQQTGSPFADPRPLQAQITGFQSTTFSPPLYNNMIPQQTGSLNSVLSPPLQPQNTGMNSMNGLNGSTFSQPPPPVPQLPQQFAGQAPLPPPIPPIPPQSRVMAPLQPQKTGPAPNVKFGLGNDAKKLAPQPTGRRANLSQATPENPFGF